MVSPLTHAHSARYWTWPLARARSMTSAARHWRLLLARSGPRGGSDEGEAQSVCSFTVCARDTFPRLVAARRREHESERDHAVELQERTQSLPRNQADEYSCESEALLYRKQQRRGRWVKSRAPVSLHTGFSLTTKNNCKKIKNKWSHSRYITQCWINHASTLCIL